jgi:hypothetical protein
MPHDEMNQDLDLVPLVSRGLKKKQKPDVDDFSDSHVITMFLFLAILAALSIFG